MAGNAFNMDKLCFRSELVFCGTHLVAFVATYCKLSRVTKAALFE